MVPSSVKPIKYNPSPAPLQNLHTDFWSWLTELWSGSDKSISLLLLHRLLPHVKLLQIIRTSHRIRRARASSHVCTGWSRTLFALQSEILLKGGGRFGATLTKTPLKTGTPLFRYRCFVRLTLYRVGRNRQQLDKCDTFETLIEQRRWWNQTCTGASSYSPDPEGGDFFDNMATTPCQVSRPGAHWTKSLAHLAPPCVYRSIQGGLGRFASPRECAQRQCES